MDWVVDTKVFVDLIELIKSIALVWIGMFSFSVLTMEYHESLIKLVLVDNNGTHAASVFGHKHIKNGVPLSEIKKKFSRPAVHVHCYIFFLGSAHQQLDVSFSKQLPQLSVSLFHSASNQGCFATKNCSICYKTGMPKAKFWEGTCSNWKFKQTVLSQRRRS